MAQQEGESDRLASDATCHECGAPVPAGSPICWLCYTPVKPADARPGTAAMQPAAEASSGFSLASLMMFMTLLSVVFGLITIAPGIGVPLGVLLLVAWGRAVGIGQRRAEIGRPLTRSEQVQTFFSSFGLVLALILMVTVGVFVAAGALCFGLVSLGGAFGGGLGNQVGIGALCVVAFLAALGIIRLATKLNNSSWRHATGEDVKPGQKK